MSIAVIVPVLDGEPFLADTLASVRAQTLPVTELIVVDDGSRDGSAALAERLGARVLRQSNGGPGAARNAGIEATSCEWIAFLDADDAFMPDKLARQMQALRAAPDALGVCGDAVIVGGARHGERKHARRAVPARLTFADLLRGNPVIASSVLVRRAALVRVGGFDVDRVLIATEDYDLWLRLLAHAGGSLVYVDEPLVRYRVHGDSLSQTGRFLAGVDRIMQKMCDAHPRDAVVLAAAAARRAEVRVDAAWACLQRGERRQARDLLAQARAYDGLSWKAAKMWLRSLV